jgi:CPA2 family monovalent cation:H+ antiporter-2
VIICGFGPVGQNLALHLNKHGLPYVITEMNITTVNECSKKGFPIYFGDAASSHVLEKMGVRHALAIAVTMVDPNGTAALIQEARRLNPKIVILVRVRFVAEIGEWLAKGATEVISEELEVAQIITDRLVAHTLK